VSTIWSVWPAIVRGAGVAGLAAHFAVEGRLVEHEEGVPLGLHDFDKRAGGGERRVAEEGGRLDVGGFAFGGGDDNFLLLRGAGALTLLLHQFLELRRIDGEAHFRG